MVKLCDSKSSAIYWVNLFTYRCKNCGKTFEIMFPNDQYLAKFREINGDEMRWMPTYGKGGVVDLMTKLIPKFSINDEITTAISKQFIVELNKYCEQGKTGNGFEYCHMREECEKCRSTDVMLVKEKVLTNPELSWLKISCALLE